MKSIAESTLDLAAVHILRYAVNKGARDKNKQAAAWAITHYERMRRKVLIEGCSLADIDAAIDGVMPRTDDLPDEPTPTFTGVQRERQAKRSWKRWLPW